VATGSNRLRWRLTVLYCLVSVVSGAVLLLITQTLIVSIGSTDAPAGTGYPDLPSAKVSGGVPGGHVEQAKGLLIVPGAALAIMALISLALGWVLAGRMLRPVRTMTDRLQRISERNVHERLSVTGPPNELKDLADTVDGLLGRLDAALDAHRRFVANAAHELRTPLTVEHALLEEPLIDPDADVEAYRANFHRLLTISEQRTRLLESLLTLSSSEHGRDRAEPVDLAEVAERVLRERAAELARIGISSAATTEPAPTRGDPLLIERLVANLCDNAIHYNVPDGSIRLGTHRQGDRPTFWIANTGPFVPPERVGRLFEPFQRLQRTTDDGHHGLGLSIVRAIASAHGAEIVARPLLRGGLEIQVRFPDRGLDQRR
jgi:signal transduction histidine kinase